MNDIDEMKLDCGLADIMTGGINMVGFHDIVCYKCNKSFTKFFREEVSFTNCIYCKSIILFKGVEPIQGNTPREFEEEYKDICEAGFSGSYEEFLVYKASYGKKINYEKAWNKLKDLYTQREKNGTLASQSFAQAQLTLMQEVEEQCQIQ